MDLKPEKKVVIAFIYNQISKNKENGLSEYWFHTLSGMVSALYLLGLIDEDEAANLNSRLMRNRASLCMNKEVV